METMRELAASCVEWESKETPEKCTKERKRRVKLLSRLVSDNDELNVE